MNLKWGIFVLLSISRAIAAATCYDPNGNVASNLVPCNPTAAISMCCMAEDYCLSNNLCFNGVGNNLLTNKGCTDVNWASPCHNICKAVGFAQALFPCPNTEAFNSISYVCGDPSACSIPASVLSIAVGTVVLRPDQIAALTSSSVGTGTSSSTFTPASTTSSGSTGGSAKTASPPSTSKPNSLALGLGLGIGIPFGLALIGGLVYFTRELKKYNNNRANIAQAQNTTPAHTEFERGKDSSGRPAFRLGSVGINELPGTRDLTSRAEI